MRCGAAEHCLQTVRSQPTTKSLTCHPCLELVAEASNGLNANATDTEVLALVRRPVRGFPVRCMQPNAKGWCAARAQPS